MPPQPSLPTPTPDHSAMLSNKFGREVANYFSGNPLNRVAFLRGDHVFLSRAFRHPSASFLLCRDLQPLVHPTRQPDRLAWLPLDAQLRAVIGEDPWQDTEGEMVRKYRSDRYLPQMVFLGLDEAIGEAGEGAFGYQGKNFYRGAPFFAVDVSPPAEGTRGVGVREACEALIARVEGEGYIFAPGRVMDIQARDAAIYAEARQLLDWNVRNPFCAACGHRTLSVNAGFKRVCPPTDLARHASSPTTNSPKNDVSLPSTNPAESSAPPDPDFQPHHHRPHCPTRHGVSNLSFPRTDPTVIMAIVNSANTHLLLGRQRRWPPHWYSTLAGFAEPAESIEEAVRREVYEEAGVRVGRVVVHSTQPWPYPANLMIGAVGQAVPGEGESIDLGHDPELDDARWFGFEEVREALKVGTSGLGEEAGPEYKEGGLRLPPRTAIANQLMTSVVGGFVGGGAKI